MHFIDKRNEFRREHAFGAHHRSVKNKARRNDKPVNLNVAAARLFIIPRIGDYFLVHTYPL